MTEPDKPTLTEQDPSGNFTTEWHCEPPGPAIAFRVLRDEWRDTGQGPLRVIHEVEIIHTFNPDWTLAPAALLNAWMAEHAVDVGQLARLGGRGNADFKARLLINEVLARMPLSQAHAEVLARGTNTSVDYWLGCERNYRQDLALGRRDVTPEDDDG